MALGVSVERRGLESGFVWSATAWGVASLHAALCGIQWSPLGTPALPLRGGSLRSMRSMYPPGVSKNLRLDFLSRLSYEGGVNKRSLPLLAHDQFVGRILKY